MPRDANARRDLWLAAVAVVAGLLFFSSLARLWPLADANLTVARGALDKRAREVLASKGFDTDAFESASLLSVNDAMLDYTERTFGREQTQAWVREGLPLVTYQVLLRRRGEPDSFSVLLHPDGDVLGWNKEVQEDEPGALIDVDAARAAAVHELAEGMGLDPDAWPERGVAVRERPARTDRVFTFERTISTTPELRERTTVTIAGATVVSAWRSLVLPGPAGREARSRDAAPQALWYIGLVLLSVAVIGAFSVFLVRLRDGSVRLGRAALWATVVFVCSFATTFLHEGQLFAEWDPLWPRWVSTLQVLVTSSQDQVWTFMMLLALIAAGDELDRRAGANRGESLWLLGRGRLADPRVGAGIARGSLVGLLCGGVLAASVLLLAGAAGARTGLQPRGFFVYVLNSSAPSISTVLFFTNIALLEELGYRFFSGTWLLAVTRRRWIAILAPAVVYGLTHTTLDFLPPAEPFWGRALAMTLVGCVWGWAFFRYDALTVVVSHLMGDLFIFTWPQLASGEPRLVAGALVTIALPLLLALPSALRIVRERLLYDA